METWDFGSSFIFLFDVRVQASLALMVGEKAKEEEEKASGGHPY
jgi:hypothetical protein